jgi:hypothetical protein
MKDRFGCTIVQEETHCCISIKLLSLSKPFWCVLVNLILHFLFALEGNYLSLHFFQIWKIDLRCTIVQEETYCCISISYPVCRSPFGVYM